MSATSDARRARAATPSIRRGTSCSRRRPARARRACSSSATSTCCAPASIPTTSSRSPSRARPPPRCASASSSGCARRAGCREFDRGAVARAARTPRRHRHLDDRRVLPVAAARVSARSRRRSRLRPGRRHRGRRGWSAESLDQALRICRALARDDDDVALVFAQLGERRLRDGPGGAARSPARRAAGARAGISRSGPRDLTRGVAPASGGAAAARRVHAACRAASTRFWPTARCAIRSSRCWPPTCDGCCPVRDAARASTRATDQAAFRAPDRSAARATS